MAGRVLTHIDTWSERCAQDAAHVTRWTVTSSRTGALLPAARLDGDDLLVPIAGGVVNLSLRSRSWESFSGLFSQDALGIAWCVGHPGPPRPRRRRRAARILSPTDTPHEVAHGDPALLTPLFDPVVTLGGHLRT